MVIENSFAFALLNWYKTHQRTLPWRISKNPYHIWVSEIMLQQTRVDTVIPYYNHFLAALPDVASLAAVQEETLLKLWEGLGYYSRVRNMQKAAKILMKDYGGQMPPSFSQLQKLPGIGPYTAGAIASIAFALPVPAVDGNVLRVFSRLYEIEEDISFASTKKTVFELVAQNISTDNPGDFNQALMDLGSTLCTPISPKCHACPLRDLCQGFLSASQERYPIKLPKPAPRLVPVTLGLFFDEEKVLVQKRSENLLKGLWVFPLVEGDDSQEVLIESRTPAICPEEYEALGLLGQARHVFTHKIWEMNIYGFRITKPSPSFEGSWVSLAELYRLPMPTAVKKAKELAKGYLTNQRA